MSNIFGVDLVTGLFLAGTSNVIESRTMRKFPRWKSTCRRNKAIALGTTIGFTALLSATVGAAGLPVLVGQTASTAWMMTIGYRDSEAFWGRIADWAEADQKVAA